MMMMVLAAESSLPPIQTDDSEGNNAEDLALAEGQVNFNKESNLH